MSNQSDAWTDHEDAVVQVGWKAGLTDEAIAAQLRGRTAGAVRRRRQAMRWVLDPAPVVDRDRLRELHAEGRSTAEIAEALGATLRTVQQLRWGMGLPARRGRPPRG